MPPITKRSDAARPSIPGSMATIPPPTRATPAQLAPPGARVAAPRLTGVASTRSAVTQPVVTRGRCHRCGALVIACRDREDRIVPVEPEAVPGGELIVNRSQYRIVEVLSQRAAAAARRRGDLGFVPHARVCRRPGAH